MSSRRTHEETPTERSSDLDVALTAAPGSRDQHPGWSELGDLVVVSLDLAEALAKLP